MSNTNDRGAEAKGDDDPRARIRAAADVAVQDSHNAIKQVWVALFAGGTALYLKSAHDFTDCFAVALHAPQPVPDGLCKYYLFPIQPAWTMGLLLIPLYCAYILTLYRFYVGNIRIFDIHYIETGKLIELIAKRDKDPRKKFERYKHWIKYVEKTPRGENLYLMLKTLVIVSLTTVVNEPPWFLSVYAMLLTMDVGWLTFRLLIARRATGKAEMITSRGLFFEFIDLESVARDQHELMFPDEAGLRWSINNGVCLLALLAVMTPVWLGVVSTPATSASPLADRCLVTILSLGALVVVANCIADLFLTWRFYNPRFSKAYELIEKNIDLSARANRPNGEPGPMATSAPDS